MAISPVYRTEKPKEAFDELFGSDLTELYMREKIVAGFIMKLVEEKSVNNTVLHFEVVTKS